MPAPNSTTTLFTRLRRASALRLVFVVAAILASQSSAACALEEAIAGQGTEWVAGDPGSENPDPGCCSLCPDCTHCGGCCGIADLARDGQALMALSMSSGSKLTPATVAPRLWVPPTLLKPPIDAA